MTDQPRTEAGELAEFLREYAAMTGRTPEQAAMLWADGKVVVPPGTPVGADSRVGGWVLFDGPEDLSERSREYVRGLAEVSGMTPGEYVSDRVARGLPVLNATPISDDPNVSFGVFDGPGDLSTSCEGFGG
jgi:hypothetical protein